MDRSAVGVVPLSEFDARLFEGSPGPILVIERQSCRIVAANPAAAATYGYRTAELHGLPIAQLWPKAETLLRRGARFDWGMRTWRHRRKDGEWIDVLVTVQTLSLGGRAALALRVSDVTERELSVALLEGQGRVLEMVARGSPLERVLGEILRTAERLCPGMLGSVLRLDEASGRLRHGAAPSLPRAFWRAVDGLRIGPRAGSCGTAAYTGRQVICSDIATDPLWEDYRELALEHGLRACWSTPILSRGRRVLGVFAMYYREPRSPGEREVRVVRASTDAAAIAMEREIAHRALEESEARLRAIVDEALAVVFLKDLGGRYILVNKRFEEVSGMREAEILGRTDAELFPGELAAALRGTDRLVLEADGPVETEESFPQADGRHIYLTVKFPLRGADGRPYAVCGIATDITRRKMMERALEDSSERLRGLTARLHGALEAERARIALEVHDVLGQMLTALRMRQALLARKLRETSGTLDRAAAAADVDAMQSLCGEILAAVSRIATQLRPQVLDSLGLEAALEWQAAEFSRDAGIACEVALPPTRIASDHERDTALFRIFQEALTNVARHSGATRVNASLRQVDGTVELVVADDGRSITAEELNAATALGLLGMRERAAILGGETSISGAPGRGTTVTVRLPAR